MTFTLNGQLLNGSALATAVVGGQGESLDAAAGTDTAGQHVVGVQVVTTLRKEEKQKHCYGQLSYLATMLAIVFHLSKFACFTHEELDKILEKCRNASSYISIFFRQVANLALN